MITELTHHLLIQQGAKFARTMQIKDSDKEPVSCVGWTPHASIKNRKGGIIVSNFASWNDASIGLINLVMNKNVTEILDFDTGYYTVILVNDSDPTNVTRLLKGKVYLSSGVTELSSY